MTEHSIYCTRANGIKLFKPSEVRRILYIFCILVWTINSFANGFNILTSGTEFIRQPNDSAATSDGPAFFGYDFVMNSEGQENPKDISFIIGSPKGGIALDPWFIPGVTPTQQLEDNPNKPGDLFSCGFSSTGGESNCKSINPANDVPDDPALMIDGDSMGLKLVKQNPESNDLISCAPLRVRNCTSDYLTQGVCFTSKDGGKKWLKETKQASLQCPVQMMDLIFVLDGSGSVTSSDPGNFDMVKTWVKTVAGKFDLTEFAHVGVIQYSHWYKGRDDQPYIKTEIALGQHSNQQDFEEAVDKIMIQGYTTYTAHAINKTVDDFMDSERFNDTAAKKVLILLTDGRSNDVVDLPVSAEYARSLGITVFAVGVAGYSEKELQIIATGEVGNNQRVYGLQKFSDLQQIVGSLQKSITGILEGSVSGNETNDLQNAETGLGGTFGKVSVMIMPGVNVHESLILCEILIL
ncbi:integrin alpha-11-like [Styela clava]